MDSPRRFPTKIGSERDEHLVDDYDSDAEEEVSEVVRIVNESLKKEKEEKSLTETEQARQEEGRIRVRKVEDIFTSYSLHPLLIPSDFFLFSHAFSALSVCGRASKYGMGPRR